MTSASRTSSEPKASVRICKVEANDELRLVQELPLTKTRYVIGRNRQAEIYLDDSTISRVHAELVCGPFGRWWIHDLGSTNGLELGGEVISQRLLRHRDVIHVGAFTLEFRQITGDSLRPKRPSQPTLSSETLRIAIPAPPSARDRITPAHLAKVTATSRAMLTADSGERRLEILLQCFIGEDFPGDAAVALRIDGQGRADVLSGPLHRFGPDGDGPYTSAAVIQALWEKRQPLIATNLHELREHDVELSLPATVRPMAVIAAPLSGGSTHIDVLYVEFEWRYATEQWRAMVDLLADNYRQATMVGQMKQDLLTSARIEHDLEMAMKLQSRLLPDCSDVHGLDVAVGYEPSHWVGGDYVDALHFADGRILMVIADVCGKGLSAALVSSSVHTMIHAHKSGRGDLLQLVSHLNEYLCDHLPDDSFVTLLAIALDPTTGAMECLNAGHPAAVVVSPTGQLRWLQAEQNVAVGMLHEATYDVQHTTLARDEVLLLYTDGAFERFGPGGKSFDPAQLAGALAAQLAKDASAPAAALERHLSKRLATRRGRVLRSDDTTFLIARYHPDVAT